LIKGSLKEFEIVFSAFITPRPPEVHLWRSRVHPFKSDRYHVGIFRSDIPTDI